MSAKLTDRLKKLEAIASMLLRECQQTRNMMGDADRPSSRKGLDRTAGKVTKEIEKKTFREAFRARQTRTPHKQKSKSTI